MSLYPSTDFLPISQRHKQVIQQYETLVSVGIKNNNEIVSKLHMFRI